MTDERHLEWFEEWFDDDYLALYANRDEAEAERFVETIWSKLELAPGIRIGDIPCGAGRYTRAFANRGAIVTGFDLSPTLLKHARDALADITPAPRLIAGDIRRLAFAREFELVVNIFTSFGYFEDEADNERAFAGLANAVATSGTLLIDLVNPHALRAQELSDEHFARDGMTVNIRRELLARGTRAMKRIHLKRAGREREITESVRLYELHQLRDMAATHGLSPYETWGDYDGNPYAETSPRLIFLACK